MIISLPIHLLKLKAIIHRRRDLTDWEMDFIDEICFMYLSRERYDLTKDQIKIIDRIYTYVRYGRDYHSKRFLIESAQESDAV
jgi:hypothetical protein